MHVFYLENTRCEGVVTVIVCFEKLELVGIQEPERIIMSPICSSARSVHLPRSNIFVWLLRPQRPYQPTHGAHHLSKTLHMTWRAAFKYQRLIY